MGIIETIARAFSLANRNLTLIGLVFGINLVINLIGYFTIGNPPVDTDQPEWTPVFIPVVILSVLVAVLVQGGLLGSIRDLIQKKVIGTTQFVEYAKKFFVRLIGVGFLFILIVSVLWLVTFVLASFLGSLGGGTGVLPAMGSLVTVIGVMASIVIILLLLFSSYVLAAKDTGVVQAMKESIAFVKPRGFRVLGLVILITSIWFMVVVISRALVGTVEPMLGQTPVFGILDVLITSIVLSYLNVFNTGVYMSYYMAGQEAGPSQQDTSHPA